VALFVRRLKKAEHVKQNDHDNGHPHKPSDDTFHDVLHLLLLKEERGWGRFGSMVGGAS
jgi:hypothetical protein